MLCFSFFSFLFSTFLSSWFPFFEELSFGPPLSVIISFKVFCFVSACLVLFFCFFGFVVLNTVCLSSFSEFLLPSFLFSVFAEISTFSVDGSSSSFFSSFLIGSDFPSSWMSVSDFFSFSFCFISSSFDCIASLLSSLLFLLFLFFFLFLSFFCDFSFVNNCVGVFLSISVFNTS